MLHRKNVFADANSDYDESTFVLFGVPLDATSCFRAGSGQAPDEMRKASYNFETYDKYYDVDLKDVNIHDLGDIEPEQSIQDVLSDVQLTTSNIVQDDKTPIIMGGEHSITPAAIKGVLSENNDIVVIVLDAHLDLRDEYEGSRDSHACTSRRIIEQTGSDRYVSIGIRSGSKGEYAFADEEGINYLSAESVRMKGIDNTIDEAMKHLGGEQEIYLSIDMDVLDPAYAPAVGTPEPYGLTPLDIRTIIRRMAPYIIAMDLVEITPQYDHGQTALLGAKLIREFIAARGGSVVVPG